MKPIVGNLIFNLTVLLIILINNQKNSYKMQEFPFKI